MRDIERDTRTRQSASNGNDTVEIVIVARWGCEEAGRHDDRCPGHMQRLILVSNRLPVSVEKRKGELVFKGSVGGVATGLGAYHDTHESLWVGWADLPSAGMSDQEKERVATSLREEHQCVPVFLPKDIVRGYYYGFSNRTLWPLFHNFVQHVEFKPQMWEAYVEANQRFCDAVLEIARPGDVIWVQDYQLMLLPKMLRDKMPDATIGFFLHIPFPPFETFRMMPWREEVISGLLGSDLVGFHTYDYVRYFLGSARRLLGVEDQLGRISLDDRLTLVDAFPMGIDYDRYADGVKEPKAVREAETIRERTGNRKLILGIDRLDYTKGIPERLRAFDLFLERHPEWRGRVVLIAVAVPSRTRLDSYRDLKREVDELVGMINGRWSTLDWTPVRYHYRSLPFHKLVGMYAASDIALVTPLRDGMNLIAKEYVAAHTDGTGVLVLSEMAGAAREMGEAMQVNPNDLDGMADAIHVALEMPEEERRVGNQAMQQRLKRYTVSVWAEDFLGKLEGAKLAQVGYGAHLLDEWGQERLISQYCDAKDRLLFIDYDGTLMPFADRPENAPPDPEALELLKKLTDDPRNEVVIISGRNRKHLDEWLKDLPVQLSAEHGCWIRGRSEEWVTLEPMSSEWMERIRPMLEIWVDRTPGSYIEEKEYSIVWHYRGIHPGMGEQRVSELREALVSVTEDLGLSMVEGAKLLEIKPAGVNKGSAAHRWMCRDEIDFVLAIGDDRTDEDIFEIAPSDAWTIRVGRGSTHAHWSMRNYRDVRALLTGLVCVDGKPSD